MQLQITIFFKQGLLTVERNVVLSKIDCAIAWPDASETDAFTMKIKQHDTLVQISFTCLYHGR